MLKATFKSSFDHKGTERHVYTVTGSEEELATFKEARGTYYTEDTETNQPLFYTNFRSKTDSNVPLVPSKKNPSNYRFDEADWNSAISKANAIGGVVGQAMAMQLASALMPTSVINKVQQAQGIQQDLFADEPAKDSDDLSKF